MAEQSADYERAGERQEAKARWFRDRVAALHVWFQGYGPKPRGDVLAWAETPVSDTHNVRVLMAIMAEQGHIPPPSDESIAKAKRELAAMGLEPWASEHSDGTGA